MDSQQLRNIIEAALLAAGGPLSVDQLKALFGDADQGPEKKQIREVLAALQEEYAGRGIELKEVASGFRVQVRESMGQWLTRLWEERPPRYTRALMETLAIIAYRQPVTRGDIEEIRGVAVSSNIIRTLLERDWIKVVGHRDVPGKPAMFGTTRFFLDYFGLKKLDDLPPLAELAELEPVSVQLELGTAEQEPPADSAAESAVDDAGGDTDQLAATALDTESGAVADDAAEASAPDVQGGQAGPAPDEHGVADEPDEDIEVSDEELAAALAVADAVDKVVSGTVDSPAGEEPADGDNVASLDEARDRSTREPETDFKAERAEVVPLKQT